jgi:DNA-binding NarL/FixJ family response regulator
VGIATDFGDVFRLLPTVHPDVVILDIIGMCGSPLATVKRINQDYPGIRIIMFSSSISMAPEMLAAGAKGYVAKDEVTDQLIQAIYAVYTGGTFVSPLVQEFIDNCGVRMKQLRLTPRERDVLQLIVQGHKTIPIAETLGIDPRSVDNYVLSIRRKTGCETRTDIANWYRRMVGEPDLPVAV